MKAIAQSRTPTVSFCIEQEFLSELQDLPWVHPVNEWSRYGVRLLNIKRGHGRHPVVFVGRRKQDFVVKELGLEGAKRELENYREMLNRGIHTLLPAGYVVREEQPIRVTTQTGKTYERNIVAYSVTLLMDRVLPDSLLYKRAFKPENRKRIWDAIVDLFVELHANGVYWGDASLANTLVKFLKVEIPYVGKKTQLKAFLADAETVEIHDSISDSLRRADLDFFFESMEWINEDLRASGIIRDELATAEDKAYLRETYERLFEVATREKAFDQLTGLGVRRYLGPVRDASYLETLEKHIAEHKWYLSARRQHEIPFSEAAQNWLQTVFVPVCELLKEEEVLKYFPGKTASELYVEVMTHKYYLSQRERTDVGIIYAMRDYARNFAEVVDGDSFWDHLGRKLKALLGEGSRLLLGGR